MRRKLQDFIFYFCKPLALADAHIISKNDHICAFNFTFRQLVLYAHRALNFDLDLMSVCLAHLLDGLGRHIRMCDSCRAGCYSHDFNCQSLLSCVIFCAN